MKGMKGMKGIKQKIPSPYWNELHVEKSKILLKEFGFDLQNINKNLKKPSNILCKKLLDSHVKRWGRGDEDLKDKKKSYRSRCMKINPLKRQKNILRLWIDCGRSTYNMTVNGVANATETTNKYQQRNRFVTRTNTQITNEKHLTMMHSVPKDVQAKSCFEACAAKDLSLENATTFNPKYKSQEKVIYDDKKALASIEKKLSIRKKNLSALIEEKERLEGSIATLTKDLEFISKFISVTTVIKKRTRKNPYAHIFIPKTACTVSNVEQPDGTVKTFWNIYPKYRLGPIEIKAKDAKDKTRRSVEIIDGERFDVEWIEKGEGAVAPTSDFQIRWSRRTNEWHIITSKEIKVKDYIKDSHRTVVIDPGVRTALTCLDMNGKMENLGENWVRKIKWRTHEMDRCNAISLKGLRGGERFAMLKLKRKHHLHRRKIQNIVNEMHKKDALRLINDNDVIVLPKLKTKGILKREGGIGRENNRFISLLSPCGFHDYITWKARINGKIVIDQNEAYTTKTCFECGYLSDPGAKKTYKCNHCDNVCDRDVQGCFNILSKYMGSYTQKDDKDGI